MTSWKKVTLQNVFNFTNGKGIKKSLINDTGKYPVMGANGVIGYTEDYLYDHPINIIGRVGSSGEIHRSNSPCWVSDNAIVAKSKDNLDDLFGYYLLSADKNKVLWTEKNNLMDSLNIHIYDINLDQTDILEAKLPYETYGGSLLNNLFWGKNNILFYA